jgi:hypothetical protein
MYIGCDLFMEIYPIFDINVLLCLKWVVLRMKKTNTKNNKPTKKLHPWLTGDILNGPH